jgi:hypothetical protein
MLRQEAHSVSLAVAAQMTDPTHGMFASTPEFDTFRVPTA